ncbi:MAG: 30S ribosomal protein S6 [Xenococcaceae cyanobacterium MO_188.B19]|nr:30S ribosomal protein S6 [Xenococcaceae cyanobacterium MO_188.B19]
MSDNYEMMYILRPDLSDEQVTEAISKYQEFLSDKGETNITVQHRGKKRLAYPIKKYLDGIYIQMNWQGHGQANSALARAMRLSEEVIRYLTLKLDKPVVSSEETAQTVATQTTEETVEA